MTALAGGTSYPAVKFPKDTPGKKIRGRIISISEGQATDYNTKQPKTWRDGNPILQVRVGLEMVPGDESSRQTLYAEQGSRLFRAIQTALADADVPDLAIGDELEVLHTGSETAKNGAQAKTFTAAYFAEDPTL